MYNKNMGWEGKQLNYIKKIMITFLCLLMFAVQFGGIETVNAAAAIPTIGFVGVDHSPLIAGDSESFYITTNPNYTGKVQYRIFLYTANTGKYEELTGGKWSPAVDGRTPYKVTPSKAFQLGKYKVYTYIKRAGATGINPKSMAGSYDSLYKSDLNCVARDDARRFYANTDMDIEKDTYTLGETVKISGLKNITGMQGPYYYKLHIFNPLTKVWTNDVQAYRGTIEWTPTSPGIYVLDLWGVSEKSNFWTMINADPSLKLYQIWKLKVITVKAPEKYISIKEDTPLMMSIGGTADERYATTGEKFWVYEERDGYYKIKIGKVYGYIPVDKAEVLTSKPMEKTNIAWQPIYYETKNIDAYDENTDLVNVKTLDSGIDALSPTWFYNRGSGTNPTGIYSGEIIDREYVRRAHQNGYEVWPRYYEDDSARAKAIFTTPAVRSKVISEVVQNAIDANADGVNIDFEGLGTYAESINDFTAFVRDLSASLHNNGLSVSVDVTRPEVNSRYSSFLNRAALAQYCDYVILIAYDEHYKTSAQPGSVGSYSWVEDSINKTIAAGVPADKLIVANPFYSYDYSYVEVSTSVSHATAVAAKDTVSYSTMSEDIQYKTADIKSGDVLQKTAVSADGQWYTVTIGGSLQYVKKSDFVTVPAYGSGMWTYGVETLFMRDAVNRISINNGITYYDSTARQTVATYTKDGIKHVVWLENADSMNWRCSFVAKYNLKGAGAWALSFETPDVWPAFKTIK
jgi:spore germination protein YaaH